MTPSSTGEMLGKILLVLAIAGIIVSAWLTWHHYGVNYLSGAGDWCDVNALFNCDVIAQSAHSQILGIPVAVIGLLWFSAVLAFPLFVKVLGQKKATLALMGWSILGTIGIGLFVYIEIFAIKVICLGCTLAHIIGLAILAVSLLMLRNSRPANVL